MESFAKTLIEYQTRDGKCPFLEWLHELKDDSIRARVRTRLDRLILGNPGDFRSCGRGVIELRFHFGSGFRVYFAIDDKTIVVLLCGGDKGTQSADIRRAHVFWADYQRRKHEAL